MYSLRIFGRHAYNPDTDPDVWRRYLKSEFEDSAGHVEMALANATRILPVVLTVHGASAGNNTYWPEMYMNMSIPNPEAGTPYTDSPSPRVFGNVSPMDPQIFLGINDCARELMRSERSGKYTPVEAAQWIEDYADAAAGSLIQAEDTFRDKQKVEFRRMSIDVAIAIGLGRFFAAKFRSGVLFGIYEQSGERTALEKSVEYYRKAREHWAELANRAKDVYKPDITIGENPVIRGHWLDRLPAIDEDISLMAEMLGKVPVATEPVKDNVRLAILEATGRPDRPSGEIKHNSQNSFRTGEPINIEIFIDRKVVSVMLYYRQVNHAKRFETAEMKYTESGYQISIPAAYTVTEYPIQYYFRLKDEAGKAWLYPGFGSDLDNQPYIVLRQI
jgi:hypothetical protein